MRPPTITMTPTRKPANVATRGVRGRPGARGRPRARQRARDRQRQHDRREPPDQHGDPERDVVPGSVGRQPGEGGAVVLGDRRVGVGDLGQPVQAGVQDRVRARFEQQRRRGEGQHHDRDREHVGDDQLHRGGPDLLAEELRGAADHQAGDEHRHRRAGSPAAPPRPVRRAEPRPPAGTRSPSGFHR